MEFPMGRDSGRDVQGERKEVVEEVIQANFDLFTRLADSDLPVARDASNALKWYYENSHDPNHERRDSTQHDR